MLMHICVRLTPADALGYLAPFRASRVLEWRPSWAIAVRSGGCHSTLCSSRLLAC